MGIAGLAGVAPGQQTPARQPAPPAPLLFAEPPGAGLARVLEIAAARRVWTREHYERATANLARPLRVAYVSDTWGVGGAEWSAYLTWRAADPAVQEIRLYLPAQADDLSTWLRRQGMDLRHCPPGRRFDKWVNAELGAWRPDVVDHFNCGAGKPAEWLNPAGAAVYATMAGMHDARLTAAQEALLTGLFCISGAAAAHVTTARAIPRYLVPYGVPERARRSPGLLERYGVDERPVILWTGRLAAFEKDVPVLKQVVELVAEQRPDALFVVIGYWRRGTREQEREWRAWCQGRPVLWLADVMPWAARRYYREADLALITSRSEGSSLHGLDALAAGVPIVSTRCGGPQDYVLHGETGWLAEVGDAAGLAGAVVAGLELPAADRASMGRDCRTLAAARHNLVAAAQRRVVEYHRALYGRYEGASCAAQAPLPSDLYRRVEIMAPAADLQALVGPEPIVAPQVGRLSTSNPKRIAIITYSAGVGGLQYKACSLAVHLQRRGHALRVLIQHPQRVGEPHMARYLEANGVPYRLLPESNEACTQAIAEDLAEYRPDVVQTGWLCPIHDAVFGPWRTVGWMGGVAQGRVWDRDPAAAQRYDQVVMVSHAMEHWMPPTMPAERIVIPNAVDFALARMYQPQRAALRERLGIGPAEVAVLWSGRLSDRGSKRADLLMELVRRCRGVRFIIAGPWVDTGAALAREMIETLRVERRAVWLPDLMPWQCGLPLAAADGYLLTSDEEGLPLAALEALTAGLPLVLTDAGGSGELVNGENGWVVPTGDVDGLQSAIERLAGLPADERARMGAASKRLADDRYAFRWFVERYAVLYEER